MYSFEINIFQKMKIQNQTILEPESEYPKLKSPTFQSNLASDGNISLRLINIYKIREK